MGDHVIRMYLIGKKGKLETAYVLTLHEGTNGPHWNWAKGLWTVDVEVLKHLAKEMTDGPGQCSPAGEVGSRMQRKVDLDVNHADRWKKANGKLPVIIIIIVIVALLGCGGCLICGGLYLLRRNTRSSAEMQVEDEKETEPPV